MIAPVPSAPMAAPMASVEREEEVHRGLVRAVDALVDLDALDAPGRHGERDVLVAVVVVVELRAVGLRVEDAESDHSGSTSQTGTGSPGPGRSSWRHVGSHRKRITSSHPLRTVEQRGEPGSLVGLPPSALGGSTSVERWGCSAMPGHQHRDAHASHARRSSAVGEFLSTEARAGSSSLAAVVAASSGRTPRPAAYGTFWAHELTLGLGRCRGHRGPAPLGQRRPDGDLLLRRRARDQAGARARASSATRGPPPSPRSPPSAAWSCRPAVPRLHRRQAGGRRGGASRWPPTSRSPSACSRCSGHGVPAGAEAVPADPGHRRRHRRDRRDRRLLLATGVVRRVARSAPRWPVVGIVRCGGLGS